MLVELLGAVDFPFQLPSVLSNIEDCSIDWLLVCDIVQASRRIEIVSIGLVLNAM